MNNTTKLKHRRFWEAVGLFLLFFGLYQLFKSVDNVETAMIIVVIIEFIIMMTTVIITMIYFSNLYDMHKHEFLIVWIAGWTVLLVFIVILTSTYHMMYNFLNQFYI